MKLTIEIEREADGRWIGAVTELPGVLVYAETADDAARQAVGLALRVIADRVEHGETGVQSSTISWRVAA
jgi:predicted RNase H-like HicB family nuclease